ncbi:CG17019 [Drosophila busckii]|uniref:CG17019 n=1 Tax=Drosophila busckii TaxID=30019 RepID=A0A0M4EE79_DROBS|nr:uncharacterized protein LOC108596374 [Drosophila busckii]ALC42340.1 CG17019 [Drosophila busckii]
MPCESCGVEFTVFRRKRSCFDCRRYYCNTCLTATTARRCKRCAIFAQRPLLRTDLLKLKPKDLIFYLQSKHISTEGCLEKEELVSLVLTHVAQTDRDTNPNQIPRHSPRRGSANPMDSLKQTCQNFFTNLSDNISDSFASFDSKQAGKSTTTATSSNQASEDNSATHSPTHIFEQPRVSTREIPTYASARQTGAGRQTHRNQNRADMPNVHASPTTSSSHTTTTNNTEQPVDQSECECSDEEIMTTFSERTSQKHSSSSRPAEPSPAAAAAEEALEATSAAPGCSKHGSLSSKADAFAADGSSQSSFEELGAIGGISDESKAATDTNSSNMEQWQLLEQHGPSGSQLPVSPTGASAGVATEEILEITLRNELGEAPSIAQHTVMVTPPRLKKVTRRRSDGYLNRRHHSSDEESPLGTHPLQLSTLSEQPESATASAGSSCHRCGKNKTSIRRQVEKMRRHLENSQMDSEQIKLELQQFLSYLEQRTKSVDCSENSHLLSPVSAEAVGAEGMPRTPSLEFSPTQDEPDMHWDDDEGIHVYAAPHGFEPANCIDSRFVNLQDFEELKDLENLTVKQLKEVLMLHRVDYKGCCEKQELLDRVERLWKTMRTAPAVEKLPTDELCKICMDAPIECVFLECGHMATCTSCGKVLNECPICRQYIVRVVRFFRA